VLEVGVGLGYAVREAVKRGCDVSALDICQRALDTVADVAAMKFLHREADRIPPSYFDLITHHLVTQHMSDTDLRWQLPHVIRSLRPTGRLHIQWAGSDVPGEDDLTESIIGVEGEPDVQNTPSMMGGRMVRSEAHARELIEEAGGTVVEITDRRKWQQYASSWFCMKVVRTGA
jgi:SAM-dependent methyltransferase